MSYTYEQKKRETTPALALPRGGGIKERNIPNSMRLAALESGQASPTAADKGHRVDLPEAMREKMESSFGMDFSNVKLYESRMLGETDAEAMAQGNEIAFAPGKFDVSSMEGQARLGHELSHVASQARGEVHGGGFLEDSALEARADREGAMAARGESVYGGAVAPLSSASPAAMAGPMQAMKADTRNKYVNEIAGRTATDEERARLQGLSDDELQSEYKNYTEQMNLARQAIDGHLYYRGKAEVRNKLGRGDLDEDDDLRMKKLRKSVGAKYLGRAHLERRLQFAKGMLADRDKIGRKGGKSEDYMDMYAATGDSGNKFNETGNLAAMFEFSHQVDMNEFKKEAGAVTDEEEKILNDATQLNDRFLKSKYNSGSGSDSGSGSEEREIAQNRLHQNRMKPLWKRKLGTFNHHEDSPEMKRWIAANPNVDLNSDNRKWRFQDDTEDTDTEDET